MGACHELGRCLCAYADGELDPSQSLKFDSHVEECERCACRVRFERVSRTSVREICQVERAPEAVKARMSMTVGSLDRHGSDELAVSPKILSWRVVGPMAAAAAVALVVGVTSHRSGKTSGDAERATNAASFSLESFVDEIVDQHAHPLPPETTSPSEMAKFDQFVGVPVHAFALKGYQGQLIGGRVLPVRNQRTAMLQYVLTNGHRVSVYVYNPRAFREPTVPSMRQQVASAAADPVYVGYIRGYSVALTNKRGVGYAVASDLDEQESSRVVAAVDP